MATVAGRRRNNHLDLDDIVCRLKAIDRSDTSYCILLLPYNLHLRMFLPRSRLDRRKYRSLLSLLRVRLY